MSRGRQGKFSLFPRLVYVTILGAMRYSLAVIVAAATIAGAARAQDVPNRADAIEIRKQFMNDLDTLHAKFTALANAIPAEKYSWRPAPGVRSIGEVFMHVSSEFYVWAPIAYGAKASPVIGTTSDAVMKQYESKSTKADVLKALKDGFAYTRSSIDGLDPNALVGTRKLYDGQLTGTIIEASFGMAGDLHEHLGQLIAYARMNGITPPWSK
jgi:DinB superfamily